MSDSSQRPDNNSKSRLPDLPGTWWAGGRRPLVRSISFRLAMLAGLAGLAATTLHAKAPKLSLPPAVLDYAGPAAAIGLSFAAACVLGFLFRKFIKALICIAALLALASFIGHSTGLFSLDWASIQGSAEKALDESRTYAQRLLDTAKHILPSATAAFLGLWRGSRRDSVVS